MNNVMSWMCGFEPRMLSWRPVRKPLMTASRQRRAAVPIQTPTIGTVVKNVKNARSEPIIVAVPATPDADSAT